MVLLFLVFERHNAHRGAASQTDQEFDKEAKEEERETGAERRHDKIVQMRDKFEEGRNDDSQETGKPYQHLSDTQIGGSSNEGSTDAEKKARWGGGH